MINIMQFLETNNDDLLNLYNDITYNSNTNITNIKSKNALDDCFRKKIKLKKLRNPIKKEGNFNTGRWSQEEHLRFIEAILKYGNEWKNVQKLVKSRSSTQARSHAQKFFFKMKKNNLINFDIDLNKNFIKSLHEFANTLDEYQYSNIINSLNLIAHEKTKPKLNSSESQENVKLNEFKLYYKNLSSFNQENSFNKEITDNLSELTASSTMNNNYYLVSLPNYDDQLFCQDIFDNSHQDNVIFNISNTNQRKTSQFFSHFTNFKKEHNNKQLSDDSNNDNNSEYYPNEGKRKSSFQSSFNFSFNSNYKFYFSEDETENLKLFSSTDNSNNILENKCEKVSKKDINNNYNTRANIFKSFQSILKSSQTNKFPSDMNFKTYINSKKITKKLFAINNNQTQKKCKTLERKKIKFITHNVYLF